MPRLTRRDLLLVCQAKERLEGSIMFGDWSIAAQHELLDSTISRTIPE